MEMPPSSVEDRSLPEDLSAANAAEGLNVIEQNVKLPRVVITFCTQCRWMLRAAYVSDFLFVITSFFGSSVWGCERGRSVGRLW